MSEVIEAVGLTKWYGRRRGVLDVSFAIRRGEVFGFLGPNGAGKTTTIRLVLGLLRPTSGHVTVFAEDAWSRAPEVHRRLAYAGSDPAYLGELTAGQQLEYLGRLRGLPRRAWGPLVERLELDPSVPIRKLSRGNRQKVAIVQVFMGHEPLLVMDEPTSGLDPLMQREFLVLIAEARAAGRTVFLSSHNLPEVERACDRVGVIRDGRIVETSSVADLQASHWRSVNLVLDAPPEQGLFDVPGVRVVSSSTRDVHLMVRGDVNPLLQRLASVHVLDVSIATLDIEDVFLHFYDRTESDRSTPPAADSPSTPVEVSR